MYDGVISMTGRTLSHFEILDKLGEGGMGAVYRARDTQLNRTASMKVLHAGLAADPERRRRFIQEARAASALNHPNISAMPRAWTSWRWSTLPA